MTSALRSEAEYILPETNIVELDGIRAPIAPSVIAGALGEIEADVPAKPKKPRKKKSATGRKRGRPVKAKAEAPATTTGTIASATPISDSLRIAPSGEGIWDRLKRVKGDTWLIVAACFAAIALGTSIAFMVIR